MVDPLARFDTSLLALSLLAGRALTRVLLIHHAPTIGGGSSSLLDVARMLEQDHEVAVSCPTEPVQLREKISAEGIRFVPPPAPMPTLSHYNGGHSLLSRTFWIGVVNLVRYGRQWRHFFETVDADLIIVNSVVLVLLGRLIRRSGKKAVCYVRETMPSQPCNPLTPIVRTLLDRSFDAVLFLSHFDLEAMGLTTPRTAVVRDVLRPGLFTHTERDEALAALGLSPDSVNVLYVGGKSRLKGADTALKAMERLHALPISMIFAGELLTTETMRFTRWLLQLLISHREALFGRRIEGLLRRARASGRVALVGAQWDMTACYAAADLLIFPSSEAHQARPIFEAGHFCLPAIVSDFPHTGESLTNMVNGLTSRPRSSKLLAQAIRRLAEDSDLRKALGAENNRRTAELHDIQREGAVLRALLDALMLSQSDVTRRSLLLTDSQIERRVEWP